MEFITQDSEVVIDDVVFRISNVTRRKITLKSEVDLDINFPVEKFKDNRVAVKLSDQLFELKRKGNRLVGTRRVIPKKK